MSLACLRFKTWGRGEARCGWDLGSDSDVNFEFHGLETCTGDPAGEI